MRSLSRLRNALVLVAALCVLWGQAPSPVTSVHVNAKLTTTAGASTTLCADGVTASKIKYVRAGASGSATGNDWTNAYTDIPASLTRGWTYCVADGSYGNTDLDDVESGTQVITIAKATIADHGVGAAGGWLDSYGDGQADFVDIDFYTDYWVVSGQTRNESDWADDAAYGFKNGADAITINWAVNGFNGDHVTVKYVSTGGTISDTFASGLPDKGFQVVGGGSLVSDITISYNYIHNVTLPIYLEHVDTFTIEKNYFGASFNKEIIRGRYSTTNGTIRYNFSKNGCQDDPDDATANGCTAEYALWEDSGSCFSGCMDNVKIYGNVIWNTINIPHTDGCIVVGGDGVALAGPPANNSTVHNNTFVGIQGTNCDLVLIGGGTGNVAANNLWYGLGGSTSSSCRVGTCQTNSTITSPDPFVASASGNFHLAAETSAGTTLSSPYNLDPDGVTRGTGGTWSRGAFEFAAGVPGPDFLVARRNLGGILTRPMTGLIQGAFYVAPFLPRARVRPVLDRRLRAGGHGA